MDRPPGSTGSPRRAALDAARLAAVSAGGWQVRVVAETGSTNSDLAAAARGGAPAGTVLVAELQTAGRGRLDRRWAAPPGTGLTFSVLLRPDVPAASLSWLPMVVGAALVGTLRTALTLSVVLKWPNDVLLDERKLAGVLVEVVPVPGQPPAAVVGVGLNVAANSGELPPGATSATAGLGAEVERTGLLIALLDGLRLGLARWEADPSSARDTYLPFCSTIGRWVRVELPDGRTVEGIASDVDAVGRLVVDGTAFSAADVVHATPGPSPD